MLKYVRKERYCLYFADDSGNPCIAEFTKNNDGLTDPMMIDITDEYMREHINYNNLIFSSYTKHRGQFKFEELVDFTLNEKVTPMEFLQRVTSGVDVVNVKGVFDDCFAQYVGGVTIQ